jgi:phospholipid/cholesterol/gamma-HCH transport system permease protein
MSAGQQAPNAITGRSVAAIVGRSVIDSAAYVLSIATLIGYAILHLARKRHLMPSVGREVLKRQILFTGVEALPFVALIALLTSSVVVVQGTLLSGAAGRDLLGTLLVTVVLRELGPLIVAFIVIGRSGAAIAAELANMRVHRELDTLEAMGVDPFDYLVIPRMAGVIAALLGLTVAFVGCCLAGGWGILQFVASTPMPLSDYTGALASQLGPIDIVVLLAKTVVPGLLVAAIACHEGLSAALSSTDIPRAATRGVVRSLSAVFLWDAGVTALVYLR